MATRSLRSNNHHRHHQAAVVIVMSIAKSKNKMMIQCMVPCVYQRHQRVTIRIAQKGASHPLLRLKVTMMQQHHRQAMENFVPNFNQFSLSFHQFANSAYQRRVYRFNDHPHLVRFPG
jgi:hypothetical protein